MYKQGSSVMDYLNPKKSQQPSKKRIWGIVWKWTKVLLFLFIIISMIWGCVQMYQSTYMVQQVTDMTGAKVFAPGTTFEIVIRSLGDTGGKNHMFIGNWSSMQEYSYNVISSWGDAFRVTKSPFYGFFVYPLAYILIGLVRGFAGTLTPDLDHHSQVIFGVSVMFAMFITVLVLRGLVLAFSWKQQANQDRMQDMQQKQAEITAKYKAKAAGGKMTVALRQQQQAETQALYKKEGIKPMANMAMTFAPLPFLFAFYAIVRSSRALKDANIGAISLIEQPWHQLTHGQPAYLALLLVYLPLQIVSMLLPIFFQYRRQRGVPLSEAQKKSRRRNLIMQIVMLVVFIFIVASIASGVAIYWIFSSAFQIAQTVFFYYFNKKRRAGAGNAEKQRRLRQQKRIEAKQNKETARFEESAIKQNARDEKRAKRHEAEQGQKGWALFVNRTKDTWDIFADWVRDTSITCWNGIKIAAKWCWKYIKIAGMWIGKSCAIAWNWVANGCAKGWKWFMGLFDFTDNKKSKKDNKQKPEQSKSNKNKVSYLDKIRNAKDKDSTKRNH